jgi:UDP-N-acetylmuramate--alanine ligase
VVEADEYDRMFLGLAPDVAVVTNVEWDHVDCYPTPELHLQAFVDFLKKIPAGGTAIVCTEDAGASSARKKAHRRDITWVRYGLRRGDWHAAQIFPAPAVGNLFLLIYPDGETPVQLPMSGRHNISNAIAAIAAVYHAEGIAPEEAADALRSFRSTERRFQIKGRARGVLVVDDYAHHPTEIKATLQMARERYPDREIWAVFQPHTYTRTKALMADFAGSFGLADHVLVTDIYPARETDDLGVSSEQIVAMMDHPDARYTGSLEETELVLLEEVRSGSLLLTMGAGDGYLVGERVLAALKGEQR